MSSHKERIVKEEGQALSQGCKPIFQGQEEKKEPTLSGDGEAGGCNMMKPKNQL